MPKRLTDNPTKVGALAAAEAAFSPLAQLLLECGITSPEAESLLRAVFVHEAIGIGRSRGKKPNASRIALLTGLDRAEVARILKDAPRVQPWIEMRRNRVNRVLAGWHLDRDFFAGSRPAILHIKQARPRRRTFWTLANRYAPGVYPGLILSELVRMGVVEKLTDGRVHVLTRRHRRAEFGNKTLSDLGARIRDLLQTTLNNAMQIGWRRVCRAVESADIDPKFLPLIRKTLTDRSDALLLGVREELRSSRWRRMNSEAPRVRIGLTVFAHEEWLHADPSSGGGRHACSTVSHPAKSRRHAKTD